MAPTTERWWIPIRYDMIVEFNVDSKGYRLFFVAISLSLTIRSQFAIEYLDAQINKGVGHFGAKFENVLEETRRCRMQKKSCCFSTMHERERQTDR